ncbi:MAG: hypothetical protein WC641_02965 [Patescibacteria group bacterium]
MPNLVKNQAILQKEASEILDKLGLLDFLSKFGNAKIIGSVALGLMTWRDIDMDLAVDELKEDDYFRTVQYLFNKPEVKKLLLADNRIRTEQIIAQGIPESMYLGIFVRGEGESEWKIDLRFVKDSLVRAEKYIDGIKSRLNDENREIILNIKNTICTHPKYINKEIFGVDIYNSVLDGGVKNLADFIKYLANKGIEL